MCTIRGVPPLTLGRMQGKLGSLDPAWRRVHLVGIGGAGNNSMASILLARGYRVTGSDAKDSHAVERLRREGADIAIGLSPELAASADLVVHTAAVGPEHPEVQAALSANIPVCVRGRFLGMMLDGYRLIAVSGTHGKTTTSAMIGTILEEGGYDPTYVVGSEIAGRGSGSRLGRSSLAVVEADEAFGSFDWLRPAVSVVTNVDEDHLDHHGSMEALIDAFRRFAHAASEATIVCADHPVAMAIAPEGAITYGSSDRAQVRAVDVHALGMAGSRFTVLRAGDVMGEASVRVPGFHNVLNALASIAACLQVGVGFDRVVEGLERFSGTARRFEQRGSALGAEFYDDYAHHPVEVAATLDAARSMAPRRLVAVFQPHLFSRTAALGDQIGKALSVADLVVVTDIYGAREEPIPGVSGLDILRSIEGTEALFVSDLSSAADLLVERVAPGDLVVCMGAGDIDGLYDLVVGRA